jgi:hypothetical protein
MINYDAILKNEGEVIGKKSMLTGFMAKKPNAPWRIESREHVTTCDLLRHRLEKNISPMIR